jgi:DNA-binding CsgD family transcriptional regulator
MPAEATSFVGRRRELAEARKKLATARLVSLVGPGGVGKTRLAIRIAAGLGRGFPGGAWLAELAELADPALVGNAVTTALGPSKFGTEFKAGQQLSRDAAARLALGEAGSPAVTASAHRSAGVLGQREADFAELVAEGLSNKEIGGRLFISERTVESHVRSIMNKLGFNSRAQIAGWMAAPER